MPYKLILSDILVFKNYTSSYMYTSEFKSVNCPYNRGMYIYIDSIFMSQKSSCLIENLRLQGSKSKHQLNHKHGNYASIKFHTFRFFLVK